MAELVVRTSATLSAADQGAVLHLADAAARVDGAPPLGERVVLHLRHGGGHHTTHLLAEDPETGVLLGYAQLDTSDDVDGPSAELAVSPDARRRGVGTALLDQLLLLADEQPGRLRLWAHGTEGPAASLAASRGFRRMRRLWQMRRSLFAPLDPVVLPEGVALRGFDPQRDPEAWLALNARAFADLPDQAGWTRADLERRMGEPWFDATGFLLAHDADGRLLGFHWTKVHDHPDHPHDALGEVYVVGVDPAFQGRGLGRGLTLAGLHHLRHAGLGSALLYVDEQNTAAIALYRSLGFAPWDSDTLFRR